MKRKLLIRPQAESEMNHAVAWYEEQRAGLGREFLADLRHALDRIATLPESFAVDYRTARRALLDRFPYKVYFLIGDDGAITVIAVLHVRQRKSRLRGRFGPSA